MLKTQESRKSENDKLLLEKLISEPLTFIRAKYADSKAIKPTIAHNKVTKSSKAAKKPVVVVARPKSMAEAVASYTEKKYNKAKDPQSSHGSSNGIDEDLGEEIIENSEKTTPKSNRLNKKMKEPSDESSSDEEFESAAEEPVDSNSGSSVETLESDAVSGSSVATTVANAVANAEGVTNDIESDEDDSDFSLASASASGSESGSESESEDGSQESVVDAAESGASDAEKLESDEDDNGTVNVSMDDDLKRKINDKIKLKKAASHDEDSGDSESPAAEVHVGGFYGFGEDQNDRGSNGSTRILKNWEEKYSKKRPIGLLNKGVTCYMNAAIQAMVHIPPLQHYLEDVEAGKYNDTISKKSVTQALAGLSNRMWFGKDGGYVSPKKVVKKLGDINCMMSEYQQEDSHEYFMSLMSRLQEDSVPKKQKLNTSIMYDIFGGLLRQSVVCQSCKSVSRTKQEFYDLSLSLGNKKKNKTNAAKGDEQTPAQSGKYNIVNSVHDFFEPELIKKDKGTGYACSKCKKNTSAMKFSSIERAPEVLAIHIKRFRYNGNSNSSSKLNSSVSYPLILDLSEYDSEMPENPKRKSSSIPIRYQLISVVVHEGRSITSGHYVAHCRQPNGDWCTYDDEYLNTISEQQVLREPNAYYLLYTRLRYKGDTGAQNKKRKV